MSFVNGQAVSHSNHRAQPNGERSHTPPAPPTSNAVESQPNYQTDWTLAYSKSNQKHYFVHTANEKPASYVLPNDCKLTADQCIKILTDDFPDELHTINWEKFAKSFLTKLEKLVTSDEDKHLVQTMKSVCQVSSKFWLEDNEDEDKQNDGQPAKRGASPSGNSALEQLANHYAAKQARSSRPRFANE